MQYRLFWYWLSLYTWTSDFATCVIRNSYSSCNSQRWTIKDCFFKFKTVILSHSYNFTFPKVGVISFLNVQFFKFIYINHNYITFRQVFTRAGSVRTGGSGEPGPVIVGKRKCRFWRAKNFKQQTFLWKIEKTVFFLP